jgi:outer membrane scaffolding protein for murein synthesis (MipA/OmpV family)
MAEALDDVSPAWNLEIGSGMVIDSQAWKGMKAEVAIIPYVAASYGNWFFNGETPIGYRAPVNDWSSVYVAIGVRYEGYERNDFAITSSSRDIVFKGYDKPDEEAVISYGASAGWLSIDASRDVSNNSESNTVSLSLELPLYENRAGFRVATSISADWMDSNYVNYYYGVARGQVDDSVGRSRYHANSALNYGVAVTAMYPISDRWLLLAELSHTSLASEISNSPLIDTDQQHAFSILTIYRF